MQLFAQYRRRVVALALAASALATAAPLAAAAEPAPAQPAPPAARPQSVPAILDDDPSSLLGLSLGDVFARLGAPASVYALRGDESWQDDVAFSYGSGYAAFIYGDKLWQIRFTKPYAGSLFGLFLGDSQDKILSILGQPYENGPGYLVYRMPYKPYPVRLRLALQDERLADAYLFRADF
jgi:hypothetical protein